MQTIASVAAAALLCACIPHPGGQCAQDADCGYGLTCQGGLCETPPPRACVPACGNGFHCNDGTCALDAPPSIVWSTPDDGTAAATGQLALSLSIATPAQDVRASIHLAPLNGPGAGPLEVPLALAADGLYRGLVDASALAERDWALTPVVLAASASYGGPARRIRIDRTGPRIVLTMPQPSAAEGGASGMFLRSDTIEVRASVTDDGAGIDSSVAGVAVAVAPGMSDVSGTRVSSQVWSFQIPLRAPAFAAGSGPLALAVRARDRLGNTTLATGSINVTRALWTQQIGGNLPVRSSPAIDAHHLFVGTDLGKVVALDRATGSPLWSRGLSGPVSASPALGAHGLYVASEGGSALALDADTGAIRWGCNDLPAGLGFLSSPAIVPIAARGSAPALEAVALANTGSFNSGAEMIAGGLFLLEGSTGFTKPDGARTCALLAPVSGGASSPAVDLDGTIYAGGDDRRAHALALTFDASGAATFAESWSRLASDDISASPALGAGGAAFADESGQVMWLSPDGAPLASPAGAGDKIFASPVFAFGTLLVLNRSGALTPFTSGTALPAATPPSFAYAPASIEGASNVASTPAVGKDGTVYIAAGRALYALAPSGALLWSLPLPGASTRSSPTIGCDGTLYLGDSSGNVSAFATDSLGQAPGWSRFRHDARNTGNAALGACE